MVLIPKINTQLPKRIQHSVGVFNNPMTRKIINYCRVSAADWMVNTITERCCFTASHFSSGLLAFSMSYSKVSNPGNEEPP